MNDSILNAETESVIWDFSLAQEAEYKFEWTDSRCIEIGESNIESSASFTFCDSIGFVRYYFNSSIYPGYYTETLIWAKIGDRTYGKHPGRKYPGYSATGVNGMSWGAAKAAQRSSAGSNP